MSNAQIVGYESGSDRTATASGDVAPTDKNNTLPDVEDAHLEAEDVASTLSKRWSERERKSGKKQWYSPFDHQENRRFFDTQRACMKYIETEQPVQLELWKQNHPGKKFKPLSKVISPKRRLEDLTLPGTAQHHQAAVEVSQQMSGMVRHAISSKEGAQNPVSKMLTQPSNIAARGVKDLGDDDLTKLHRLAANRGKRDLSQAARKEMKKRELEVTY